MLIARRLLVCFALVLATVGQAQTLDRHGDPLPPHALLRLGTARFRHAGMINALAYTGDGQRLLSAGSDRCLRIWDAASGQELRRCEADQPIAALAVSANGQVAATVDSLGIVQVWDVATGIAKLRSDKYRRPPQRHEETASETPALALSPDGSLLAAGGGGLRNQFTVRDLKTGQELWHNGEHESVIYCLAFAADGQTLASTGHDGSIRLWDPASGKAIRVFRRLSEPINFIVFAPDGKRLASSSHWEEEIRLWDTATGQDTRKLPSQSDVVHALAFGPAGQTLIVQSYTRGGDSFIRQWDLAAAKPLQTLPLAAKHNRAMALAPDGKTVALGTNQGTIRRWDTATWKEIEGRPAHQAAVTALSFSPDDKHIATGSGDTSVRVWDSTTGQPIHELRGHADAIESLAYSPDGKLLASGSRDKSVRLWESATPKELRRLDLAAGVPTLAFSPDGSQLAVGSDSVYFWRTSDWQPKRFDTTVAMIQAICFPPDGRWLGVSGDDPDIHIMHEAKPRQLMPLRRLAGAGSTWALACSKGGGQLASGSTDGIVRVWNVNTGKPLRRLGRHQGRVGGLAFAPDGKVLVSAGHDGTVRWWDAITGQERRAFLEHAGPVAAVAFSRDGSRLLTAGGDGTVLVWDVPALLRAAAPAGSKELSAAELDRLWHDLLAGHGPRAGRAIQALTQAPARATPLLKERLGPFFTDQMPQLIAELDANDFDVRERASEELIRLGRIAAPALAQALNGNPPLEVRQRLEKVATEIQRQSGVSTEREADLYRYQAPALPCVEVLEKLGTPEARQLLQRLANGRPLAPLTDEARAALERLASQKNP